VAGLGPTAAGTALRWGHWHGGNEVGGPLGTTLEATSCWNDRRYDARCAFLRWRYVPTRAFAMRFAWPDVERGRVIGLAVFAPSEFGSDEIVMRVPISATAQAQPAWHATSWQPHGTGCRISRTLCSSAAAARRTGGRRFQA